MKPNDEERAMPMATGMGLKPMDTAVVMPMAPMRLVEAVCEVNSDSMSAATQNTAMKTNSDG